MVFGLIGRKSEMEVETWDVCLSDLGLGFGCVYLSIHVLVLNNAAL
jgi:hypothetical protein